MLLLLRIGVFVRSIGLNTGKRGILQTFYLLLMDKNIHVYLFTDTQIIDKRQEWVLFSTCI